MRIRMQIRILNKSHGFIKIAEYFCILRYLAEPQIVRALIRGLARISQRIAAVAILANGGARSRLAVEGCTVTAAV
jgi:hypothetical protein